MIKQKKLKKLKIPKEFVLIGTNNDGYRHRYSVKKNEQFKKIFIRFMNELRFDEKIVGGSFYSSNDDEEDTILKISDFNDVCENYKNKKYDVDVFYGSKKIILVIRCKIRKSMIDNLISKSRWKKFLKVKIKKKRKRTLLIINK